MNIKQKKLTLQEAFALINEMNEKMLDIDDLSMVPQLSLEATTPNKEDRDFEGRIMFLGEQLWDSFEDSHDIDEIKRNIAEDIVSNAENLSLIASQINKLIANKKW